MRGPVTLAGDRQTGKTHAGLAVAAVDAMRGRRVAYQTATLTAAYHHMLEAADLIPGSLISNVCRVNGQYKIELHGGGVVLFRSHGQRPLHPSSRIQTYVLDDWASSWLPPAAAAAEFVYIGELAAE